MSDQHNDSMPPPLSLDAVHPALRERLAPFRDQVRAVLGENLLAITLFGTALLGALPRGRHRLRSVLVMSRIDLEALRRLAPAGRQLGRHGFAVPLALSPEFIRDSLDSFPLELLEIAHRRHTLLGTDYFCDLALPHTDLRLQCERELKTLLIGMQHAVLAAAGQDRVIDEAPRHVATALARVLLGMVWLKGKRDHRDEVALISAAEDLCGRKLTGLRQALEPAAGRGWRQFRELYDDVTALRRFIDAW